jgi:hypothetical protein
MPLDLINLDRLNKFFTELKKWLPLHYADKETTETSLSAKANKSEMAVTDVSGDSSKKTIKLKDGLSQDVVVDISGKQDSLAFDGTYDATTNPAATVATVNNAISSLVSCDVSYNAQTGELHLDFSGGNA